MEQSITISKYSVEVISYIGNYTGTLFNIRNGVGTAYSKTYGVRPVIINPQNIEYSNNGNGSGSGSGGSLAY